MNNLATERLRQGQDRARTRVREMHPVTPYDSSVLDLEIDGWIAVWRREDDRSHLDDVYSSNEKVASAQEKAAAAEADLSRAKGDENRTLSFYQQALARVVPGQIALTHGAEQTASSQGVDRSQDARADNTRPPLVRAGWYSDPRAVVEDSHARKIRQYAGLGFAGCIEAPVIYSALARFLRMDSWITIGTSGILSMLALYLAHRVGIGLRQRHAADPRAKSLVLGAAVVGWLALGVGMFVVRWVAEHGISVGFSASVQGSGVFATGAFSNASSSAPLATAIVFALIYIAAGTLTTVVSYYNYNPDADSFHSASSQLAKSQAATADAEGRRASYAQELDRATKFLDALPGRRKQMDDSLDALAASLKSYTRSLLETALRVPR